MIKLRRLFSRYRRAHRLGFRFCRVSSFVLPDELKFDKSTIGLEYPKEEGVFHDFTSIFLDDDYGIELLKSKDIGKIIDIGANVGFFSLASRLAFPYSQIHAYEPNQNLSRYLNSYSDSLKIENYPEAVGKKHGLVELELMGDSNQSRIKHSRKGSLPMISIREAIDRIGGDAHLLKMDCEGSEWEILEEKQSLGSVRHITLEYHLWKNHQSHSFAIDAVKSHGFRILKHKPSTDFGIIVGTRD